MINKQSNSSKVKVEKITVVLHNCYSFPFVKFKDFSENNNPANIKFNYIVCKLILNITIPAVITRLAYQTNGNPEARAVRIWGIWLLLAALIFNTLSQMYVSTKKTKDEYELNREDLSTSK